MSDDFNSKQQEVLDFFKKRIFLEQTIENTIAFNKNIAWDNDDKNVYLAYTAEELIEVFKLRSDVYMQIGYHNEFPDIIEGINFDKFEQNSAVIYCKNNNKITGTTRLVFDSKNKLPSEKAFSFDSFRNGNQIGEVSRLIIKNSSQGLGLEFKNLTKGIYNVNKYNNLDLLLCGIKREHYRLYSKFGGFKIEYELNGYGNLEVDAIILSWNPSEISEFFRKSFLN
jgi:predicted GNAT family N-acyltransferase